MKVKFMLTIDSSLRTMIKREARKHGISMNEYIETVLTQFVDIERGRNGTSATKSDGAHKG
nr:MAG TPA: transcriptional repressor [Caudoviricetes sp.]